MKQDPPHSLKYLVISLDAVSQANFTVKISKVFRYLKGRINTANTYNTNIFDEIAVEDSDKKNCI